MLYDGEGAPEEAVQHIMGCPACRSRLRECAAIASEIRVLAAAELRTLPPLTSPSVLPSRHRWWIAIRKPVRVPRVAAAACMALIVLASAGWLRTIAQTRTLTKFRLDIHASETHPDGSTSSSNESIWLATGTADFSCAWSGYGAQRVTLGKVAEVLSIRSDAVVLSVKLKRFDGRMDCDEVRRKMKSVRPQEITYILGEQISVPVEGGGSVLLSGSVVREEEGRLISVKQESLLPALDEISLRMPILVRDGTEIAAKELSAGAQIRCPDDKHEPCGIFLYSPSSGLFYFSTHPIAGGVSGMAGMSYAQFNEDGHLYRLYSSTPITGGDQPRNIWVLHLKDYRPSRHGRPKSEDALDGLGSGNPAASSP